MIYKDPMHDKYMQLVVDFMREFIAKPKAFYEAKEWKSRFRLMPSTVDGEVNIAFKLVDLLFVLIEFLKIQKKIDDKQQIPYFVLRFALNGLVDHSIMNKILTPGGEIYVVHPPTLTKDMPESWLGGCMFGVRYIANNAQKSIGLIEVKGHGGAINSGTGFVVSIMEDGKYQIVTSKHNVFDTKSETPYEIISVSINGNSAKISDIVVCKSMDIAFLVIESNEKVEPFIPIQGLLLQRVYTFGYPRIPVSKHSPIIAHSGEINGYVESYGENSRLMLISADVAPGSSGGPVLNEVGGVVGVVTQSLQAKYEGAAAGDVVQAVSFNAALPIEDVTEIADKESEWISIF